MAYQSSFDVQRILGPSLLGRIKEKEYSRFEESQVVVLGLHAGGELMIRLSCLFYSPRLHPSLCPKISPITKEEAKKKRYKQPARPLARPYRCRE